MSLVVLLAWRDPSGIPASSRELRATVVSTVLLMRRDRRRTARRRAPGRGHDDQRLARGIGRHAGCAGARGHARPRGRGSRSRSGWARSRSTSGCPQLTDVAPPIALPLLLAWVPVPLAVVGLATVDLLLAPLALPLGSEQLIIVAVAIVTLAGAALAAFLQDDLRHTTGYLVIADSAFVLLGFAALTPDAWGPARTWLVAIAATKTALATWAAVMEGRFGTRSIPELRGWIRRSPLLGAALLLTTVATFGLPGWAAFEARATLAQLTATPPLDSVLVILAFLTLPTYLRLLGVGTGSPTQPRGPAAPERIVRRRAERLAGRGRAHDGRRGGGARCGRRPRPAPHARPPGRASLRRHGLEGRRERRPPVHEGPATRRHRAHRGRRAHARRARGVHRVGRPRHRWRGERAGPDHDERRVRLALVAGSPRRRPELALHHR